MKILVTGTAGFIGFHTAERLASRGFDVVGLDNINDYYDIRLKYGRLKESGFDESLINYGNPVKSTKNKNHRFIRLDIEDREGITKLLENEKFDAVCHLAAQAGARYSLETPRAYADSNITGFLNILEGCRRQKTNHLVFASSSSVYGMNEKMPFSEKDNVDHPVSLYAATKKANELMAHCYSKLYDIPSTGLRFFTVYGPWGRPDMAYYIFTEAILSGKPIAVFNNGNLKRDFTYIDDIVEGVIKVIMKPAEPSPEWNPLSPDPSCSNAPYRIYNIGNNTPVNLETFIETIENALGIQAKKNYMPMQPGDVYATFADTENIVKDFGFSPSTPLEKGIEEFVRWYRGFHGYKK